MEKRLVQHYYKSYTEAVYVYELLKKYNIESKICKSQIVAGRSCGYVLSFDKRYKNLFNNIILNDNIEKNNFNDK